MDPKIWGPICWKFLECVAETYPNYPDIEERENMRNFLIYLGKVLPCPMCRENYEKKLQVMPINEKVLSNSKNLKKWITNLRDKIKRENKKYNKKKEKRKQLTINIISIIVMIIMIVIMIRMVKNID